MSKSMSSPQKYSTQNTFGGDAGNRTQVHHLYSITVNENSYHRLGTSRSDISADSPKTG